jgi:hypothetical protein
LRLLPSSAPNTTKLPEILLPALLAATMWVRSYRRFDFCVAHGWTLGSESGSLYIFDGSGSETYYVSGPPGSYGRLEVETGSAYRPWLPIWTWGNNGDRFVVVHWWAITAAGAGLACGGAAGRCREFAERPE